MGFTGLYSNRVSAWGTGSLWIASPCDGAVVVTMTVKGWYRICDERILGVSLVGCVFAQQKHKSLSSILYAVQSIGRD